MGMEQMDGVGDRDSDSTRSESLRKWAREEIERRREPWDRQPRQAEREAEEGETWEQYCARVEAEARAFAEGGGEGPWPPVEEPHPFDEEPHPFDEESAAAPADFEDPEGWMSERPRYWMDRIEPDDGRVGGGLGVAAILERARLRDLAFGSSADSAGLSSKQAGAHSGAEATKPPAPAETPSDATPSGVTSLMIRVALIELFRDWVERRVAKSASPARSKLWPGGKG